MFYSYDKSKTFLDKKQIKTLSKRLPFQFTFVLMACSTISNPVVNLGVFPCDIAEIPTGCIATMQGLYSISAQTSKGLVREDIYLEVGDPIVLKNKYNENAQVTFYITQPNGQVCQQNGLNVQYKFETAIVLDLSDQIDFDCECDDLILDDC